MVKMSDTLKNLKNFKNLRAISLTPCFDYCICMLNKLDLSNWCHLKSLSLVVPFGPNQKQYAKQALQVKLEPLLAKEDFIYKVELP